MELRQLKTFRDVAYEQSFVKAAKLNHLTQPAISSQIKELEEELGVKLIERVPHKVTLTTYGKQIMPVVEEIIMKTQELKAMLETAGETPRGEVRIASIYSIGVYELPPRLRHIIHDYPDIHLTLQYPLSNLIYDMVQEDEVDFGLIAYPEKRPGLEIAPMDSDVLVVITSPAHPLAQRKRVSLKTLNGLDYIGFDKGIPTGEAIQAWFLKRKVGVKRRMTHQNMDTVKASVQVGLGFSIVPKSVVQEEAKAGTLKVIAISDEEKRRPLGIILKKGKMLTPAMRVVMEQLQRRPLLS